MFKVKNSKTGKIVKDAITRKERLFSTEAAAQKMADSMTRNSVINATAFNSIRPSKYVVIPADER